MKTVFDRLLEIYKTHDAIAAAFKMERQNVTYWKNHGIPSNRAIEVERKTNMRITAMDVLKDRA